MKKVILFSLLAIVLTSCGKAPLEKHNTAQQCLDSLVDNGAKNSVAYYELLDRMTIVDEDIEKQNAMLFKKYNFASSELDRIIRDARRFIITKDSPDEINKIRKGVPLTDPNRIIVTMPSSPVNPNAVRLEVEITFDSKQDALMIANQIDEAIRRSMNLNAKLINVKIIN